MPCYSTIRTKLTDGGRIASSLRDLGYDVEEYNNQNMVTGVKGARSITFQRSAGVYSVLGDTTDLKAISRKYAEIGVKKWAKTRGFAVTKNEEGRRLTLVNRRG